MIFQKCCNLIRNKKNLFSSLTLANKFSITQITNEIRFTPKFYEALDQKLGARKADSFLRLQIFAGEGCEGFTYKFKFDDHVNQQKDFIKTQTNINKQGKPESKILFAVNGEQIKLLRGATIDYAQEMMRQVFYVKQNPNAQLQCSCKVSFSPKEGIL